jgi:hypothetical protein
MIVFGPPRPSRPVREKDERIGLIGTAYTGKPFNEEFFIMDYADPSFVVRLERYWTELKELLASIRKFGSLQERFSWLTPQIMSNDYAVAKLLQDIAMEVERRWFGNLNAESRTKMLRHIYSNYRADEARATVLQYKHLYETFLEESKLKVDSDRIRDAVRSHIFESITDGAVDYARRGFFAVGKWLFEECLHQDLPMNDLDTAICHHNLAVFEFLNDEFHEMIENLQASLTFWRANSLQLRDGIDEGYMSAAYRQLGVTDKSSIDLFCYASWHYERLENINVEGVSPYLLLNLETNKSASNRELDISSC